MINISERKWFRFFAPLFLVIMFASSQLFSFATAHIPEDEVLEYIVEDLSVEDVPDDNGTGLVVSWKPIGVEARIIEYRIYRGSTQDQLFLIGTIPVNPETGFTGEKVFYHDSGYNLLTNINRPRGLRQEDQQPVDSPIYQYVPRDLTLTEHKFENYSTLAVIPKKQFYYKAEKIELFEDDEGEDSSFYAGFKDRQFRQVL